MLEHGGLASPRTPSAVDAGRALRVRRRERECQPCRAMRVSHRAETEACSIHADSGEWIPRLEPPSADLAIHANSMSAHWSVMFTPPRSRSTRVVARTTSVLCLALASSLAAQSRSAEAPAACTETPVRDTTVAVWKEIWAQYGGIDEAVRRKDTTTLRALIAPDYHAVLPNGEVWTHERTVAYQLNGLMAVYQTHHMSNSILELTACD